MLIPPEAGIEFWRRSFRLERGEAAASCIEVTDDYKLKGVPAEAGTVFYSLITPCEPLLCSEGCLRLEYAPGKSAWLAYDSEHLEASIERTPELGSRLIRNWGAAMYRIVLREIGPVLSGTRLIQIRQEAEGSR